MEDYKYLIYIALSILYFVFKNIGKKDKAVTRTQSESNNETEKPSASKTFEDIIAELSGRDSSVSAEDVETIEQAERPLERKVSKEDYANADETLKELYRKGEKLKSITELVDIDKVATKSHFEAYSPIEKQNNLAQEIKNDFADPESVKKAFIYSEIFNKKY